MAARIFGEAVDGEVGPVAQRLLPERPQERVVDGDGRALAGVRKGGVARGGDRLDIDQGIGRVGGAFEVDQAEAALPPGAVDDGGDLILRRTGGEIEPADAEPPEDAADQRLGGRIERAGMDDDVARLHEREQQGRDCGHAGREGQRVLGILPDRESVLQNLLVGTVEA
jgi:hypothetical protein